MTAALMYHGFEQEHRIPRLNLILTTFREQLKMLRREGYHSAQPQQIFSPEDKKKSILVTIDDGLAGSYTASTLALDEGFQPLLFIIGSKIDSEGFLTSKQISDLARRGVLFGSHTYQLHDLVREGYAPITSEMVAADLEKSIDQIEQITGIKPSSFAYPCGVIYPTLENEVRARFDCAFGTKPFQSFPLPRLVTNPLRTMTPSLESSEDHFRLPRVYVRRETTMQELLRSIEIPGYAIYLKIRQVIKDSIGDR